MSSRFYSQEEFKEQNQRVDEVVWARRKFVAKFSIASAFAALMAGFVVYLWTGLFLAVVTGLVAGLVLVVYAGAFHPGKKENNE